MKSLKLVSIFILSIVLFTVTSCNDEPLEGDFGFNETGNEINCAQATQNLTSASEAYGTTDVDDPSYAVVCNDYATALQNMINACGDTTGAIQTLLDALDCPAVSNDCTTAQTATQTAATAYNADTTNTTLCSAYLTALQNEIAQCGDATGSLQDIVNGLNCGNSFTLCGGNGSNLYIPLAIGNYWKWEYPFPFGGNPDVSAEVIGMFENNGLQYFELEYTGSNGAYHFQYLRYDTDGNLKVLVYYIDAVNGNYYQEHMLIPNITLTSSSEWDFYGVFDQNTTDFNYVQDVYNVNLTVETDFCEYNGCLEIFTKNTLADPSLPFSAIDYKVYKKGVGIVNFDGNVLTELILN